MEPSQGNGCYFGVHYKLLRILGLGSYDPERIGEPQSIGYNIYSFSCMMLMLCSNVSIYTFPFTVDVNESDDFYKFLSLTLMASVFSFFKLLIVISIKDTIERTVWKLEVDWKRFKSYPEIEGRSTHRSKVLTYFLLVSLSITNGAIFVYTAFADLDRKKTMGVRVTSDTPRKPPMPLYIPWDYERDVPYFLAFVYTLVFITWYGLCVVVIDTFIASILIHLSGQYQMIKKSAESVGDNAIDLLAERTDEFAINKRSVGSSKFITRKRFIMKYITEDEFTDAMVHCLKKVIKRHQAIVEVTGDFQKAFTFGFFLQICTSFYAVAFILFQTAQNKEGFLGIRFFGNLSFFGTILWQLFILTYSANEVTYQAGKVVEGIYNSSWYAVEQNNIKIRNLLIIFMQSAQRPIVLKAANFIPMSNDLFVKIIKNSYQIFTLLTTVLAEK